MKILRIKSDITSIFDIRTVEDFVNRLNTEIKTPWKRADYSTLGGDDRVSVILKISFMPKETWSNGIFQNSPHALFHIYRNGVIEQFSGGYGIPNKFRKSTVKSVDQVISKINDWYSKNINDLGLDEGL